MLPIVIPLVLHQSHQPHLQVVPVPRQALAAATLAVEPEQGADGEKEPPVKLCEKMVRTRIRLSYGSY